MGRGPSFGHVWGASWLRRRVGVWAGETRDASVGRVRKAVAVTAGGIAGVPLLCRSPLFRKTGWMLLGQFSSFLQSLCVCVHLTDALCPIAVAGHLGHLCAGQPLPGRSVTFLLPPHPAGFLVPLAVGVGGARRQIPALPGQESPLCGPGRGGRAEAGCPALGGGPLRCAGSGGALRAPG